MALSLLGCATTQNGGSEDSVLVNSQKTVNLAYQTFDILVHLEKSQSDRLAAVSPEIKPLAEKIRRDGQKWLQSAWNLTESYRLSKDLAEKDSYKTQLNSALAVLVTAVEESSKYINLAKSKGLTIPQPTQKQYEVKS